MRVSVLTCLMRIQFAIQAIILSLRKIDQAIELECRFDEECRQVRGWSSMLTRIIDEQLCPLGHELTETELASAKRLGRAAARLAEDDQSGWTHSGSAGEFVMAGTLLHEVFSIEMPEAIEQLKTWDEAQLSEQSAKPVKAKAGAWHAADETPPNDFRFGPLIGQRKQLAWWIMKDRDPRNLDSKLANNVFWGRRDKRSRFSIWFKDQKRFSEANLRKLEDEQRDSSKER